MHGILSIAERMLLGSGLREPNITTIAVEVAALEGFCDILLDDDGTSGGVDQV